MSNPTSEHTSAPEYTVNDVPLGFAPVPPQLVMWKDKQGKPLNGTEIRVWSMLAMHRDLLTQNTSAGVLRMSKMLDVDRTTIQRAVNRLVQAGFLLHKRRSRDRETGVYTPAEFTLAVGGKPLKFGVVEASEEAENHHDATTHSHDAHHDAHHDAELHTKRDSKEKERDLTPTGGDDAPTPGQFCQYLRGELDGADVPLLKGREDRYGKDFKKHINKGLSEDLLYKAADRIAERWLDLDGNGHRKLTVEQALEDVVNGRPPRHAESGGKPDGNPNGTPPEIIEYIFANTRNDVIRSGEARFRRILARFDFSTGESPPFPILAEMGGSDTERWQVFDSIQSLVRRAKREAA